MAVIRIAPRRKVPICCHFFLPGIENSSTITSEAAIYMKVPAAIELMVISTKSLVP